VRTAVSVDTGGWNFEQQGWVLDMRLRYQRPLIGDALKLSTELGASFADRKYVGYFYDVPAGFATPERPEFESDSGYAGMRLGLGLSGVSGKWRWSLFGAYMNFSGTGFEDSPLLDSTHDFNVGLTVGWMFWQSKRRVTPKNTSPGNEFETPLFGL
jgi:outer membrane scaffolding protein for murein synthesis (MipA/OmpV family)